MPALLCAPSWPGGPSAVVFCVAALLTVLSSVRLVALGDALADRTGWGEAIFGAVFFGLATSLSGIVMTAVAAADGQPQLAYGNAVGGIAAQTTAVALADVFYRRSNLEHASASLSNVLFGCLLIAMLALALLGTYAPAGTVAGVHPVSALVVGCYLGGLRLIRAAGCRPLWEAVQTPETLRDLPAGHGVLDRRASGQLWGQFVLTGALVAGGGWVITTAAENLVAATNLSVGFVGAVLMGVVNALPETVTAIAAVRRGAVTLAVAAVLGGNCLDALNLVVGDVAFRAGSLYHAASADELFVTAAGLLMTAILLGGLLMRQARGWGRLGFEGILLFATYLVVLLLLAL